jgi:ribonucleotide monophosphatase NagD (HAD superfamily)
VSHSPISTNTTVSDIIASQSQWGAFLVDASGVLYNESGVIPGAQAAWQALNATAPTFLVTNNTCHSPEEIEDRLLGEGFDIIAEQIISSGFGLAHDHTTRELLADQRVYWVGYPSATASYLAGTGAIQVDSLKNASRVVIGSSIPGMMEILDQIEELRLPVICCNPDLWIRGGGKSRFPVAGYYAKILEDRGIPIHWIGKPLQNFSAVVKTLIEQKGASLHNGACFFDDNPNNVLAMQSHLGISGCWIQQTGIFFDSDPNQWAPTFRIQSFC